MTRRATSLMRRALEAAFVAIPVFSGASVACARAPAESAVHPGALLDSEGMEAVGRAGQSLEPVERSAWTAPRREGDWSIEPGRRARDFDVRGGGDEPGACAVTYSHVPFSRLAGIRTRWETIAVREPGELGIEWWRKKDARASVQPNLGNLRPGVWLKSLVEIGANTAELNLEPSRILSGSESVSGAGMDAYWEAVLKPISERSAAEADIVGTVQLAIQRRHYTPAQRDDLLLRFLEVLERERRATGAAAGDAPALRFLVHQREWFRETDGALERARRIAGFADDIAGLVNAARARCLDHWLAGIRLGEHSNDDMQDFLPLLVELARQVNKRTGGWLKGRLFLANGGGHGADFAGIGVVANPRRRSTPYPFFDEMAKETRGFAFGYKWMAFRSPDPAGPQNMTEFMEHALCDVAVRRPCDSDSDADWREYLGRELGMLELIRFVNAAPSAEHANVVFVGDSSDSLHLLSTIGPGGRLLPKPALSALQSLFGEAGRDPRLAPRWQGRHFMQHSTNAVGETDPRQDSGFSIYLAEPDGDGLRPRLAPRSLLQWRAWPEDAD